MLRKLVVVVGALLLIGFIGNACSGSSASSGQTASTSKASPKPKARPTAASATPTADPHALTAGHVSQSLYDNQNFEMLTNLDHLTVTILAGQITIDVKPNSVLNENDMMQIGADDTVVASKAIWSWYPDATDIIVNVHADFTDQLGNTTDDVAVETNVGADTAATLNFAGLKDLVLVTPSTMYCDADSYYFHPAIWKNLSQSDRGCMTSMIG